MAHAVAVCQSRQRTDPKVDIGEGELRAGHGLVGDAHAGLSERQVSLFFKHSEAPVTVLVAKDRVTGHNPVAALYTSHSYYKRLR